MNEEPQVSINREGDTISVSAEFKVQPASFESVGAFRSYTRIIRPGEDVDEAERDLIERAVGITSLTVDAQLAVNFGQAPRYKKAWVAFAYLCPERFKPYLGIGE